MSLIQHLRCCAAIPALMGLCLLVGCRTASTARTTSAKVGSPSIEKSASGSSLPIRVEDDHLISSSRAEKTPPSDETISLVAAEEVLNQVSTLDLQTLVSEVHDRNPSLQSALAAWGAAAQRYPQMVAFEDPMLQSMFAPGSFPDSSNVQSSYYVGVAQKVPWHGKRALRGQIAEWETNAASHDAVEIRLGLTLATRMAFYDYFLSFREMDLNTANLKAVEAFRDTARQKYEANLVSQQDVLQSEVELAKLRQREIEIRRDQKIATARINTLLHRAPQLTLPPPPHTLPGTLDSYELDDLLQQAIEKRPELKAQAARIQAERNTWALACKEFYPDFEFMGRYDRFWIDREQQAQVGMNMNLPVNRAKRQAAVQEAMFKINKSQAEYDQKVDTIRNEVQASFARLEGAQETVSLYHEKILPASRENVRAALAGYTSGTVDFLRLIEAQRELIDLQEKDQQAIVDLHRNNADVLRAVGSEE